MRNLMVAAAALGLAACGGSEAPVEDAADTANEADEAALEAIQLQPDGFRAGAEGFFFEAGKNEAIAAMTNVISAPLGTDAIDECGAGPMELTEFTGGLTLNFIDGALVGWNLRAPIGDEEMAPVPVTIDGDINIGSTREEIEAAQGFEAIPDSTLGEEFVLGNQIGGFIDGEAVGMLYAGTQCFFR